MAKVLPRPVAGGAAKVGNALHRDRSAAGKGVGPVIMGVFRFSKGAPLLPESPRVRLSSG